MGMLSLDMIFAWLVGVAVVASIIAAAMPLLAQDKLGSRMKHVATEREKIRARERAKLQNGGAERINLRSEAKPMVSQIVDKFNMREAFSDKATRNKLKQAGFRAESHLVTYTFARIIGPFAAFAIVWFYIFVLTDLPYDTFMKLFICMVGACVGYYAPIFYVSNTASKRQKSVTQAWPDALDLFLICVESGMTAETGFQKVAGEIGSASVELAEELTLLTAELSYLQDRRIAYENLADRTGSDGVKAVMTSLIQAERYGTPLGDAIRVMAAENRAARMNAAEKKAAALPPKLTVPMILFFLPAIFVVVLGPAAIDLFAK